MAWRKDNEAILLVKRIKGGKSVFDFNFAFAPRFVSTHALRIRTRQATGETDRQEAGKGKSGEGGKGKGQSGT